MTSFNSLSDLENLRLFLQERIRLVDPSLDTGVGSEIESAVIQPLLDRLGPDPYNVPIRDFIIGRLQTEFPDLIVQEGEPIDDYAVKVMQILLEPFRRQIKQVSTNQTLANPDQLNENEADNLGANYFLTRELGSYASGVARLYFNAPQFSQVAPSNMISTGVGLRFFPVEAQAITLDSMLFNTEDNLYYFDVIVRSENQGEEYNIAENTLVSIADLPAVVKVSNKSKFDGGNLRETTEDFLARAEKSLSEKSLVTLRGIDARLTDIFETIRLLAVIGMGDPEMQRDIIQGVSMPEPYAFGLATNSAGPEISVTSIFTESSGALPGVAEAGVKINDVVTAIRYATQATSQHTVTRIIDNGTVEVTPNVESMTDTRLMFRKPCAGITISGIPGGITGGAQSFKCDTVHIGGALDVFVRAGDPQPRNTILEGVLDGNPLHFGVDLESFGGDPDRLTHLTEPLEGVAMIVDRNIYGEALSKVNQILILDCIAGSCAVPWKPSPDDVGRFIQLLGDGGGSAGEFGTFGILSVEGEEYWVDTSSTYVKYRCIRITIGDEVTSNVFDEESGEVREAPGTPLVADTGFDTWCRIVDKIPRRSVIRDRDASTIAVTDPPDPDILAGVDFGALGVVIGDSVVVETGDDAGIYSVRRILSWLNDNDSLVLDRQLTKTLEPSGNGDGTGLRYRIADELNIDLVDPKVTKIPLGSIFAGDDLDTVAGSAVVMVSSSTNFLLAGVEEGDTLEVFEGDNAGRYRLTSVSGTIATLDAPMATAAFALQFAVYRNFTGIDRPLVRVKTVELLDSSSQPTGITIPYGDAVDARVLGIFGNRAEGTEVESFTGVTSAGSGSELVRLSDGNRDFAAEGITAGYRLNVLNTLNANEYTIAAVDAGGTYVDVEVAADGGVEFRTSESGVHYTIGLPSAGFIRLYFQEPTSVEVQTGLDGGRLDTGDTAPKFFRFSEVEGFNILPAGGSGVSPLRDLRIVRSEDVGGGDFNTLVEFTDEDNPSAFESEILVGDVIAVHEEVKFRNLKVLNADYTWNGTDTVTCTDTSEVEIGHYTKLDVPGALWFKIVAIDPDVDIELDLLGETPPTGSGALASVASATFEQLNIQGSPAGLRTISGSNLVTVPTGSLIDFSAMNDISNLVGQDIYVDSGPDEGAYVIEEVLSAKQLRVDKVMTVTTDAIISQGMIDHTQYPQRDAYLKPSGTKVNLTDPTNNPGTVPEQYITLYETCRGDFDGIYQITDIPTPGTAVEIDADPADPGGDIPNPKDLRTLITGGDRNDGDTGAAGLFGDPDANLHDDGVQIGDIVTIIAPAPAAGRYVVRVHPVDAVAGDLTMSQLDGTTADPGANRTYEVEASGDIDPFGVGRFNWVLTDDNANVGHIFRIFNAAPTEAQILEVAPKAALKIGPSRGETTDPTNFFDDSSEDFSSVTKGDLLEILAGPNAGVYPIESVVPSGLKHKVSIYGAPSPNVFFVTGTNIPYKIWGGLHGSSRMMKVGPWQSFDGKLETNGRLPYTLRRPNVYRLSSTEMSGNIENNLYYADLQVESQGSGGQLNLPEDTRLVVRSGMLVDGYTYTVDNNVLTFSPYEEVSLDFDRRFLPVGNSDSPENLTEISGRNLKITYESSTVAKLVNDLLRSEFDRPINADPLGRHFLPSYVFTAFRYSGGLSADNTGKELEDAINQLGAQDAIQVSDLEAVITRRGATYVQHPIVLVSITHDIDRNLIVDRSDDALGGLNEVSFNGTGRISAFFAILGEGLTVEKI